MARKGTGGVMVDRGVMVVRRSVTHLLIHKLHLEACYMMSPALRNHLPEFPYQLSTKKLNLLCDFGFSWSTVCLPSWDYTGRSHLRVGWWYLLCALAALHAFSSQPLHCCTVYVYTSPLPTHYELLEDLDSHLFSSFCSLEVAGPP